MSICIDNFLTALDENQMTEYRSEELRHLVIFKWSLGIKGNDDSSEKGIAVPL